MKKRFAVLIAFTMLITLFVGCSPQSATLESSPITTAIVEDDQNNTSYRTPIRSEDDQNNTSSRAPATNINGVSGSVDKNSAKDAGKKSYDITGVIEKVATSQNTDALGIIWVKANDDNSVYDYAALTFTNDTLLLKDDGEATFKELKDGMAVEVILTDGPVLASYPVQAEAKTVVIK